MREPNNALHIIKKPCATCTRTQAHYTRQAQKEACTHSRRHANSFVIRIANLGQKIDYAINRYTNEAKRLYGVIDKRLADNAYLAGDAYTVADIATYPWLRSWKNQGIELSDYPNVKRWFDDISDRPAVQRGVLVLADLRKPLLDAKATETLFGATQYTKR